MWQHLPRAHQLLSPLDAYALQFATVSTIPYYPNSGNQLPYITFAVFLLHWIQFTHFVHSRKEFELAILGLHKCWLALSSLTLLGPPEALSERGAWVI